MDHNNLTPPSSPAGSLAGAIIGLGTIVGAHLIMTFLFWLCLNPTLRAFGLKTVGFGACFGAWSAWLMIVLVPAIIVLNIAKSMWPDKNNDLLLKLLSTPPIAVKNN